MKRTAVLFALAGILAAVALALWLSPAAPRGSTAGGAPGSAPVSGGGPLSLQARLSDPLLTAGGEREVFLEVQVKAAGSTSRDRAPVNLALVLDRSGSMAGEKIAHCRRAARHLVEQLGERDRFALVTFGSDVTTLIPSTPVTPSSRTRLLAAIDSIAEMGGTNISGGLEAGLAEVTGSGPLRSSRVILLSDGQANEGISDSFGLAALARRIAGQGVTLSAIGVGLDFNEYVMESLAEHGGGAYHYLSDSEQLGTLFAQEFQLATATVAVGPTLSLAPGRGVQVTDAYGYLSERQEGRTVVRLPDFAAGQGRTIVFRLLVAAPAAGRVEVGDLRLDYLDLARDRAPVAARVAVGAAATPDAALAARSRDAEVAADAARAGALQEMRKASESFSAGRRDDAQRFLGAAKARLDTAQKTYGERAAVSEAAPEIEALEGSLAAPAGSEESSRAAKRFHSFVRQAR